MTSTHKCIYVAYICTLKRHTCWCEKAFFPNLASFVWWDCSRQICEFLAPCLRNWQSGLCDSHRSTCFPKPWGCTEAKLFPGFLSGTTTNVPVIADTDECLDIATNCGANTDCTNTVPGYFCTCKSGYETAGNPNVDDCTGTRAFPHFFSSCFVTHSLLGPVHTGRGAPHNRNARKFENKACSLFWASLGTRVCAEKNLLFHYPHPLK